MPRITIDIEGAVPATQMHPGSGSYDFTSTSPAADAATPPDLQTRARAIGAHNAGPAPSAQGSAAPAPEIAVTSDDTAPYSETGGQSAGPAPAGVLGSNPA